MNLPLYCPKRSHSRHTWAGGWRCWICPARTLAEELRALRLSQPEITPAIVRQALALIRERTRNRER
jgi:hypothetical protein